MEGSQVLSSHMDSLLNAWRELTTDLVEVNVTTTRYLGIKVDSGKMEETNISHYEDHNDLDNTCEIMKHTHIEPNRSVMECEKDETSYSCKAYWNEFTTEAQNGALENGTIEICPSGLSHVCTELSIKESDICCSDMQYSARIPKNATTIPEDDSVYTADDTMCVVRFRHDEVKNTTVNNSEDVNLLKEHWREKMNNSKQREKLLSQMKTTTVKDIDMCRCELDNAESEKEADIVSGKLVHVVDSLASTPPEIDPVHPMHSVIKERILKKKKKIKKNKFKLSQLLSCTRS